MHKKSDIELTCCFPVEIKSRDFDARLLLAAEFAGAGFTSLIGSKKAIRNQMKDCAPFLYFDKGMTPNDQAFCQNIHRLGGIIVNLDEEGGVIEDGMFTFLARYPSEILPYLDLVLLWGKRFLETLQEARIAIEPERIEVTGHPRFDLRKKKYFPFYQKESNRITEAYAPYILVNTSFAYANHVLGYEKGIAAFPGHFAKKDPMKDRIDEAYYRMIIYYFIRAIQRIAAAFPETKIVLRPHPSECVDYYKKFLEMLDNVVVIQEGAVQSWIIGAQLIIHHDCTTAIEAVIAGKPVVSYCPIRDNELAPALPMDISDVATTENELISIVGKYIEVSDYEKGEIEQCKVERIKPCIDNVDTESVSRILEAISSRKEKFVHLSEERLNIGSRSSSIKQDSILRIGIQKFFKYWMGFQKDRRRYVKQKLSTLEAREIEERLDILKTINPKLACVGFEKICDNGFVLRKRAGL